MPSRLLDRVRRDDGQLDPVRAIAPGMTVHASGRVWAWVTLPTRSTDEVNTAEQFRLTTAGAATLRQLLPAGAEFQFKVQWSRHRGDGYVATELAKLTDPTAGQRAYITLGGQRITANAFPRRQVLLGVELPTDEGAQLPAALRRRTRRLAGQAAEVADATLVLHRVAGRARTWCDRMAASTFAAHAATPRELAWAYRRDLRRTADALPESALATGDVARLVTGCYAEPHADHMAVETDEGTSYLRLVTAAQKGYPTADLELPGSEWLKELTLADDLEAGPPVPVEVSIRGRNLSAKEAASQLTDAIALAKEQGREASHGVAEEPPAEVVEARAVLTERLREVRQGTVGMVADSVVWLVEAGDLAELDRRTHRLTDHYAGQGIALWTPRHVQDVLYRETVLGDRWRFRDTEQLRPWTTLVGGWFHGGSKVGDDTGPVLGGVIGSTPQPFRSRLTDAQLEGKPVTSAFVGQSGAGKSTAVMLSCLAEAVLGAWVMLTDFKGDLHGLPAVARSFGVPVTEVSTAEQASGSMCAFRYVADPQTAASMATDDLLGMLRLAAQDTAEPLVRAAANAVATRPSATMRSTHEVIQLLRRSDNPAARAVGDDLAELAADPLARPVAGPYDRTAAGLPTGAGLVYLRAEDLRMPNRSAPQATWRAGQRLSMVLMQAVLNYATYMAGRVKGLPKVVALTELHLVTPYDSGKETVANLARLGRALDANLLLDTQACAELVAVEGLLDQVSAAYCFRVKTDEEADAQARLLGLTPEPLVRARQKSWAAGECEVRDRHGDLAPVAWDYLSAEIAAALDTTPVRLRAQAAAGDAEVAA